MPPLIDITNKTFGNLTVLGIGFRKDFPSRKKTIYWKCKCSCGEITYAIKGDLVHGKKKSCGCIMGQGNITHGMSGTKFYSIWNSMKDRCTNPNSPVFKHYGGRGIGLGVEWFKFSVFMDDMYDGYVKHQKKYGKRNTTLERIDNNGWYTKENCKWATYKEQVLNKRTNKVISYNGVEKTLSEWADTLNIKYESLYYRLITANWDVNRSLETPIKK